MKIINIWSLHYENFIMEIEAEEEEEDFFRQEIKTLFPKKIFLINNVKGGSKK